METSQPSSDAVKKRRRPIRLIVVLVVIFILLALGLYAFWNHETRFDTGVALLNLLSPSLMPTSRLVENLQSPDTDLQRESLAALAEKKDPAGLSAALPLLKSNDAYVWLNAALYLGALKRPEAMPYLIKGLRHQASMSYPDCASDLSAITGQSFGTSFQKWHEWWEKTHPSSNFDFDSNLGRLQ